MPKNISLRILINKFHQCGFDGPHPGGRHLFMKKGELKIRIPNPHGADVSVELVYRIIRQAGISKKDWDSMDK